MSFYLPIKDSHMEKAIEKFKDSEERELIRSYYRHIKADEGLSNIRILRTIETLERLKKYFSTSYRNLKKEDIQDAIIKMESNGYSEWTKITYKLTLKKFLRWIGYDVTWFKIKRRADVSRADVLTEEDVKKMMDSCSAIRDKTLISLLWESGARVGEIANLKTEDVSFERYGTRLRLDGKTGRRNILVISSTPYLVAWLNEHPSKNEKSPYLFVNYLSKAKGQQISYVRVRNVITEIAKKANVTKKINPHWFRHSRATFLAKKWTETQLKKYLGWGKDSRMPGVYTHLSCRDTDEAMFEMYGIKEVKYDLQEKPIECMRCKFINGFAEKICNRCGALLDIKYFDKYEELKKEEIMKAILELKKENKL